VSGARRMSAAQADVIVVGLGAVGSATCHYLARAGARVIGIDRFVPPHDQGSSHGLSRVTRLAVGEGEVFVPLVTRSHALWRELEARTGESLYRATGGLVIASAAADAAAFHGAAGFFERTVQIAQRCGIEHELLSAAAIRARYPQFTVRDDEEGYFEPAAGVLFPERAVAAHLAEAKRHGATLRLGERVQRFAAHGNGDVEVSTDRGRLGAARVVVAAGPWTPGLAGGALRDALRVQRQVLYWFRTTEPRRYAPEVCPIFIWMHGSGREGAMYGMPTIDGVDGVKVATEQYDTTTDPDHVDRHVTPEEVRHMYDSHVAGRLAGLLPEAARAATCLYTSTPDAMFRIRAHDLSASLTVVSACSGHGFKHSAALGESIAARVLGATPAVSLAPWEGIK
jgi:sarcosine oxidase